MTGDCTIQVAGCGFTEQQVADCIGRLGLLSLEVQLPAADGAPVHLSSPGAVATLYDQALKLGAKRVWLIDHEANSPMLQAAVEHAARRNLRLTLQTGAAAAFLPEQAAMLDAHEAELHLPVNATAGLGGGEPPTEQLHPALPGLWAGGYRGRIIVSMPLSGASARTLPETWRWARRHQLEPRPAMAWPDQTSQPALPAPQALALLEELARIDREEFGRPWPHPASRLLRSCLRHLYSCHVSAEGVVYACAGLRIPLGRLRDEPLGEIVSSSEVLENLRAHRAMVKSPCGECAESLGCYGCRGAAMQLTQDYLAPDPMCARVVDAQVDGLPHPVRGLIPHGPRMQMVDRLVAIGEREVHTECVVAASWPFVDDAGFLDPLAHAEIIAQSLAAAKGFHPSRDQDQMHSGLLLGIKSLQIHRPARVGDHLHTRIRKVARLGGFGIAEGRVQRHDSELLAVGQVKVWTSDKMLESA